MWQRLDNFEAPLCASDACNRMGVAAAWRFESGGVGSAYCQQCKDRIETNQQRFDGKEANYVEFSGARRGDMPGWRNRHR